MMIYYKNIFLNISNSLNSRRVSTAVNPNADLDVFVLARASMTNTPVVASNGKQYYYFGDFLVGPAVLQYLLNTNGVLAYRRYSGYQTFYGDRRPVVRVPVEYVVSHPVAAAFIDKVMAAQSVWEPANDFDIVQYLDQVRNRMRQK